MHVCQTRLYFILLWHIKGALYFLIFGILRNIDEHLIISLIVLLSFFSLLSAQDRVIWRAQYRRDKHSVLIQNL